MNNVKSFQTGQEYTNRANSFCKIMKKNFVSVELNFLVLELGGGGSVINGAYTFKFEIN